MQRVVVFLLLFVIARFGTCVADERYELRLIGDAASIYTGNDKSAGQLTNTSTDKEEAAKRQQIFVSTSNSIYQFALIAAEDFASHTKFRTPIVEPVGTGMGFKQFCSAVETEDHGLDVVFASRQIRPSELALCKANGFSDIKSVNIGYDGIVFVVDKHSTLSSISRSSLAKGLSKNTLSSSAIWGKNEYKNWQQIDRKLPSIPIQFFGPSLKTSSSDAVAELVLVNECIHICCKDLPYKDRYAKCSEFRDDTNYVIGNDDARLIIKKLNTKDNAIGIISYNSYAENTHNVKALMVDNVAPTRANMVNGSYNIVRPLWVYVKGDNISKVRGLSDFMQFIVSEGVIGPNGLLVQRGLIPIVTK